ncbi:alpha/beta fold hydrolase [Tessaracoccus caeni]|uniref:alpha/beta fold hydrolase n=1 Tax=Tessaracoccus caeni TaxID=3031239 RepID=UPI0023DA477B|nr:alpha/beta fold hydrolase [Tessaracoccus caeni]MDF1489073.1 alpha/beta fold hydrolase [Tessaracoccus caeni]
MDAAQAVVFIHGLGDAPGSWAHQIASLPDGFVGIAVNVPGLAPGGRAGEFSLGRAADHVIDEMDRLEIARAHLCGLSLGAMIAFRAAVDHPERVLTLTLAAGQVKPPRTLMAIQHAIMRVLPEKVVSTGGASKAQMLAVLDAVARVDFTGELPEVAAPTLVLCGSKDRPNLPAARRFAKGIRDAELVILDGAGHQSNTENPAAFSAALNAFLCEPS